MSEALWVTGDTLDVLRKMPDASVDLVMSSPPFLALRSYLPPDDPAKAQEIGQEATPGEFLDVLLDITEECARVLAPHGTLAIELGDTYSGSGGAGGDYAEDGLREGQETFRQQKGDGWPLAKSLCLIPEMYRFALAYGFNPLTQRQTDPWRIRNVVRWCRPNPPVGALGDKFRPGTSDLVVACKSGKRWFDLDAVRTEHKPLHGADRGVDRIHDGRDERDEKSRSVIDPNPAGAPPLDWWEIPTAPYKGSHYATYPRELVVRPVKAMCPLEVCTQCGEPRRRIVEQASPRVLRNTDGKHQPGTTRQGGPLGAGGASYDPAEYVTTGWTDCDHGTYRPGRVLDIFAGSGTTLEVATGHGRDAIGIDLDRRNALLAHQRLGMFLTEATVGELAAWLDR